jgi:acetylornithine/N-succinyldiaminopimelate aminotransferase
LPFNDEDALAECFKNHRDEIAAVITEGIQGVGGIRVAADTFLRSIREHCDHSGALMIADSVQCGYGRTGNFFAHDHAGISADIYTIAKGMGNGFPVAGVLIAPHIKPKHGMLGTTFGGNPLACAAALAVLEIIRDENLMANATTVGNYLMEQLRGMPALQQVRGRGLMIGFDVPTELSGLKNDLLSKTHVFTGEAKPSVIRLLPPLSLSLREADVFLKAIQSLLSHQTEPTF